MTSANSATVTPIRKQLAAATEWLSPQQVCERVPGLSRDQLRDMRSRGTGPRYHKPTHKTVIYSSVDIDSWVAASAIETRRA